MKRGSTVKFITISRMVSLQTYLVTILKTLLYVLLDVNTGKLILTLTIMITYMILTQSSKEKYIELSDGVEMENKKEIAFLFYYTSGLPGLPYIL